MAYKYNNMSEHTHIYKIPEVYKLNLENINFMTLSDGNFKSFSMNFNVHVQLYGMMPNYLRIQRVIDFYHSINDSVFMSTKSDLTPIFLTGTVNNVTFEVPMDNFNSGDVIQLIRMKTNALLGDFGEVVGYEYNENSSLSVGNITYSSNIQEMDSIDIFDEESWVNELMEMNGDDEDLTCVPITVSGETEYIDLTVPWWKSDDGRTRDFVHGIPVGSESDLITTYLELTNPTDMDEQIPLTEDGQLTQEEIKAKLDKLNHQDSDNVVSDDEDNPWITN